MSKFFFFKFLEKSQFEIVTNIGRWISAVGRCWLNRLYVYVHMYSLLWFIPVITKNAPNRHHQEYFICIFELHSMFHKIKLHRHDLHLFVTFNCILTKVFYCTYLYSTIVYLNKRSCINLDFPSPSAYFKPQEEKIWFIASTSFICVGAYKYDFLEIWNIPQTRHNHAFE